MRYTLFVLSPPETGNSNRQALRFAEAAVAAGHQIACTFFFDAGVLTGLSGAEAPQDEDDLRNAWESFANSHQVPMHLCVASAARFGLQSGDRRLSSFELAGLGELVEAGQHADRVLSFGD
ncbi:MAG: sulfurtransferase complex subunit TusD [Congregibacter sp.]